MWFYNQERSHGGDGQLEKSVKTVRCGVKKSNAMLWIIKKGIENKEANIIMQLYNSMVRPYLVYCAQF